MLSCVHDPCINCAASAYAEQVHIKGQNKDVSFCTCRSIFVKFVEKKLFWILQLLLSQEHLLQQQLNFPQKIQLQESHLPVLRTKEKKLKILAIKTRLPQQAVQQKRQFTIANSIANNKYLIIASLAGLIFALNVRFMVMQKLFRNS